MDADAVAETTLNNARNWLRLVFHALTCKSSGFQHCSLGVRCLEAKNLIMQLMEEPEAGLQADVVTSLGRLLEHYLTCLDGTCAICSSVWSDISLPSTSGQSSTSARPRLRPSGRQSASSGRAGHRAGPSSGSQSVQFLQFLLYALMFKDTEASSVVMSGKLIWQHMLGFEPQQLGQMDTSGSKHLIKHRATCIGGYSCSLCAPTLSFFARSRDPLTTEPLGHQRPSNNDDDDLQQAADALTLELDALLQNMATQLSTMHLT